MKRRNLIIIAIAAVIAVGLGGYLVSKGKKDQAQEVETTVAKRTKIVQKVNGTGKIQQFLLRVRARTYRDRPCFYVARTAGRGMPQR